MTRQVFEIPLSARSQRCSVTLLNVNYQLAVQWRAAAGQWVLDLLDASGNPVVQGLPLVTGSDLLGQFGHLGIGGALVVMLDSGAGDAVTFDNLGTNAHLRFVVER
ncbi:hypothetical protein LQ772_06850 [Frateuria edaphi]|uniref:phage baseplate plug family protein n=1 Tax=Frateuria edaphi TaxID=2898793 RepID=UPI001E623E67|nr:hypothetical protein [Frateuria edaphi]UGB47004.1 hypothetical protein LQ772_06850 [Frateuria edaphi]